MTVVKNLSAYNARAWAITLTASLFFFYEFIQLIFPNAINVELMTFFDLNATQLGWLVSTYFCANALFLFPAGILLDRFSTKLLLLFAVIICTIGTFIFALAKYYLLAAIARFIVGIGAAFCFLSCIRLASRWFPPNKMALVTGIVVTMAMLGGFVAQSPMVFLSKWIGWQNAILINAILGLFITLAIYILVEDRPPNSQQEAQADKAKLKSLGFWRCLGLVLMNKNNWLAGIYTSLLNLPVFLLGGLWGMNYLVHVHHLTEVQASYVTSMLFVGVIIGSPAFGWFSDHIGRRCLPMILGAIASLIVMLAMMYIPNWSLTSLIVLFFIIGFVTSSQVLSYPAIAELNPLALTSTAVSIASVTIMISGVIFQPLFGHLLEWKWHHTFINQTPIYSVHDYNTAMWIMPIGFILSIFIAYFIRETYCESQVH